MLRNKLSGVFETITPAEFLEGKAEGYRIIDTCLIPSIEGVPYVR